MTTLAPTTAYWKNKAAKLEQQRDELLALLKAVQDGQEWTLEFCQKIDETIARIETK